MEKAKQILLVEDDPKSLFALESVLNARGFVVHGFADAEQAAAFNGQKLNAAIIDIRLPNQQGPEFAKLIKARHPEARIILVSAYNGLPDVRLSLPEAMVIAKPIDIGALIDLLHQSP